MKRKRIKVNRKMMAWSDGVRTNVVPSVFRQVDDYGRTMWNYYRDFREGDEHWYGTCAIIRDKCRCYEYDADRAWEQGRHLRALKEMMRAALWVLPDESEGFEFEDVQWLCPQETLFWHRNVQEFLRYNRRCIDYCKRDPNLWPIYNGSSIERDYHNYLRTLGQWVHDNG